MDTIEQHLLYSQQQVRIAKDVDDTRTVTFVASDATKDRHGSVVNMNGWDIERFNANPIIGYQHNVYGGDICNSPDPDDVIGTGRAYISDVERDGNSAKQLLIDVTFEPKEVNEKAEKVFHKVKHGSLRAVSVGFIEIGEGGMGRVTENGDVVDQDTYFFKGQELLEISVVNIPSNPSALKKSLRDSTSNALMFIRRELGIGFSDIEKMTVGDVLRAIDNGKVPDTKSYQSADEEIENVRNDLELKQKQLNLLKL